MRRKKLAIVAIVLALVIALAPTAAFAAQSSEHDVDLTWFFAGEQDAEVYDLRYVTLTPEAMEIALEDFDYLVHKILEVAPAQNILYRRYGVTAAEYFAHWRQVINDNIPLPSILSYLEPERWGEVQTDDLYIAADYLFTVLVIISEELGGLGHLGVQWDIVDQVAFGLAYWAHNLDNEAISEEDWEYWTALGYDREAIERAIDANNRFSWLHYEIFNTPSVLWFYDINPSEFDFNVDIGEVIGFRNPYNVFAVSLESGVLAYVHIESFTNNIILDSETLFPFFEEIQDYEHLIIDLRGNTGGWAASFPTNILSMLLHESISFYYYELFIASEMTAGFFENPTSMMGGNLYGIFPIAEFVQDRGMYMFSPEDLELLDYAMVWVIEYHPAESNIPFHGEIWLLVDEWSMSASEMAASISIATGFATVVGSPTAGVTGVLYTFAALPNTGILFRIDLGYTVDEYGRSIEEFGVVPQVSNAPGWDAFDTVLAVIEGYELPTYGDWMALLFEELFGNLFGDSMFTYPAFIIPPPPPLPLLPVDFIPFSSVPRMNFNGVDFVSIRDAAQAHGYTVEWDAENNSAVIIGEDGSRRMVRLSAAGGAFNANGTIFVRADYIARMFAESVYTSPLIGTWAWDGDDSFVYIFNADGTGRRGFPFTMTDFTWSTNGSQLNINLAGSTFLFGVRNEHWAFSIVDDVLTIDSLQAYDLVFSYIKQ